MNPQTQAQSNSFAALGVTVVARVWHQKQKERNAHRPTEAGQEGVPGNAHVASVPTQEVIQAELRDLAQRGNPERAELREQRKREGALRTEMEQCHPEEEQVCGSRTATPRVGRMREQEAG